MSIATSSAFLRGAFVVYEIRLRSVLCCTRLARMSDLGTTSYNGYIQQARSIAGNMGRRPRIMNNLVLNVPAQRRWPLLAMPSIHQSVLLSTRIRRMANSSSDDALTHQPVTAGPPSPTWRPANETWREEALVKKLGEPSLTSGKHGMWMCA
jgi:hypothetical protein